MPPESAKARPHGATRWVAILFLAGAGIVLAILLSSGGSSKHDGTTTVRTATTTRTGAG